MLMDPFFGGRSIRQKPEIAMHKQHRIKAGQSQVYAETGKSMRWMKNDGGKEKNIVTRGGRNRNCEGNRKKKNANILLFFFKKKKILFQVWIYLLE